MRQERDVLRRPLAHLGVSKRAVLDGRVGDAVRQMFEQGAQLERRRRDVLLDDEVPRELSKRRVLADHRRQVVAEVEPLRAVARGNLAPLASRCVFRAVFDFAANGARELDEIIREASR